MRKQKVGGKGKGNWKIREKKLTQKREKSPWGEQCAAKGAKTLNPSLKKKKRKNSNFEIF
jgi:hypothetical protein